MPAKDASTRAKIGRRAALVRHRGTDDPRTIEAGQDVRAAVLEEHIRAAVDKWPPLTPQARDRLAVLLRGGAG